MRTYFLFFFLYKFFIKYFFIVIAVKIILKWVSVIQPPHSVADDIKYKNEPATAVAAAAAAAVAAEICMLMVKY